MKTCRLVVAVVVVLAFTPFVNVRAQGGANGEPDPQTAAPTGGVSDLPKVWAKLVSGKITEICVGPPRDNIAFIATFDDSKHLSLLSNANGEWAILASTLLENEKTNVGPQGVVAPRLLVTDIDGDGSLEVVVCSNKLSVYSLAGSELKLVWAGQETFWQEPSPLLAMSDFNNDGRNDIAVLNCHIDHEAKIDDEQSLYIYSRTSSQAMDFGLTFSTDFTDEHGYHMAGAMAVADFAGDGRPEIAVGNSNGDLWLVTFNEEPTIQKHFKVRSGGAIGGMAAGNLDNDPYAELLIGTNVGDIWVMEFDEQFEPIIVATEVTGRLAYGVAAGDVDGDGRNEFLLARGYEGYGTMTKADVVVEVRKLAGRRFNRVWKSETETVNVPHAVACDLNNDGRCELLVKSRLDAKIAVVEPRW